MDSVDSHNCNDRFVPVYRHASKSDALSIPTILCILPSIVCALGHLFPEHHAQNKGLEHVLSRGSRIKHDAKVSRWAHGRHKSLRQQETKCM